jgi:hypothetical protein
MITTTTTETNRPRRRRPPPAGPYAVATDPLADVRAALARGVAPETVVRTHLPPILRRRRLGALRVLLAEYGAADAFTAALAELEARVAA